MSTLNNKKQATENVLYKKFLCHQFHNQSSHSTVYYLLQLQLLVSTLGNRKKCTKHVMHNFASHHSYTSGIEFPFHQEMKNILLGCSLPYKILVSKRNKLCFASTRYWKSFQLRKCEEYLQYVGKTCSRALAATSSTRNSLFSCVLWEL